MVLVIKSSGNAVRDVQLIAKQMVNMESNQTIYGKNGNPIGAAGIKRPFNSYTYNSVDFEFQFTYGVIVIYTRSLQNFPESIQAQIEILGRPESFVETISSHTDYYTMVKTSITHSNTMSCIASPIRPCFRSILTDPFNLKRALTTSGSNFVWLVLTKQVANFRGSYLSIEEMDTSPLSESYLNRSTCTILYDDLNMFAVSTMTKQLNYPALDQYNMFRANQIVREPLYISWSGGLQFELYYQFTKLPPRIYDKAWPDIFVDEEIAPDSLRLKRLDLDRPYSEQLAEPFDYAKQEEEELLVNEGKPQFPNDVCFITKIPIYQEFYVGTISNATHEFEIALSPAAVRLNYADAGRGDTSIISHIASIPSLTLVRLRWAKHPRSFLEVLDMLDIDPVKKNIMRCMELYGSYSDLKDMSTRSHTPSRYSLLTARQYYVVDKTTRQIYLGLSGISDGHVAMYQNTSTILFRVINIIESDAPDPILFRDLQIEE